MSNSSVSSTQTRERLPFNDNWRFIRNDPPGSETALAYEAVRERILSCGDAFREKPAGNRSSPAGEPESAYASADFDDSGWRTLSLPHDWGVEGSFHQEYPGETGKLKWWGVGWYRKSFELSPGDDNARTHLDFDGAMAYALVWVNGRFAGGWPYGYASFRIDITPYLRADGRNIVAVRLDNPPDSSRWYPGGGIYRNVWLERTGPVHVGQWGTYITTPEVTPEAAESSIRTTVDNHLEEDVSIRVRTEIFPLGADGSPSTQVVAEKESDEVKVAANSSGVCETAIRISRPALWSDRAPNRYLAVTTLDRDGKEIDRYETPFGIRTIAFEGDRGFLLNGNPVRMNGVCQHHDLGALGSALHPRALERQVGILRVMGVNAIRTSHNPPAPELLDLCDRLGIFVIDEAFDTWAYAKKPNDYHRLFADWHEADLRAMVRRDRNHPCIVLWSTGNEIAEQGKPEGPETSRRLAAIVKDEDPTRPVTVGCHFPEAPYNGFQHTMDVFGFNYKPHEYPKFRELEPGIPCYGSETASTVSSRGEYFFPVSDDKGEGRANFHVSSYDLYAPGWSTAPDVEFAGQDRTPGVFGEFVWTGFDYLGEPTPYNADSTNLLNFSDPAERARVERELEGLGRIRVPSRSSYFGIIDLAGFRKDRFYLYQSRWRTDLPMAHILPHWNWPEREGEVTPVHVYTSGDEAELFLNGRSLGRRKKGRFVYRLRWDEVVYEPGELKVVSFKEGKTWAEAVRRTTGPAAAVRLDSDRDTLRAGGNDLAFVTLSVTDADGFVVPRSRAQIVFSITGPGRILATDNGDPTDHEPFPSPIRNAFNGHALAIVQSLPGDPGPFILRAEAAGLRPAELAITASG